MNACSNMDPASGWINLLTEAYAVNQDQLIKSDTSARGFLHSYICRTTKGLTVLTPEEIRTDAKASKLKIDDIIKISRKYFDYYTPEELTKLKNTYVLILDHSHLSNSVWARIIHFLRGMGFKGTKTLLSEEMQVITKKLAEVSIPDTKIEALPLEEKLEILPKEDFETARTELERLLKLPSRYDLENPFHHQKERVQTLNSCITKWEESFEKSPYNVLVAIERCVALLSWDKEIVPIIIKLIYKQIEPAGHPDIFDFAVYQEMLETQSIKKIKEIWNSAFQVLEQEINAAADSSQMLKSDLNPLIKQLEELKDQLQEEYFPVPFQLTDLIHQLKDNLLDLRLFGIKIGC